MRILILDIETAPNLAYVWRMFKENIGANQVVSQSYIMSFAAKWLGEEEIIYYDTHIFSERYLLEKLLSLLGDADLVITFNGNRFDLPRVNARAATHGFLPPSPYKKVDLFLVAKKEFNFERNSLEYVCKALGVEDKDKHKDFPGFELWLQCLKGNPKAWKSLKIYNIGDVLRTEDIYLKMRPWITNHPNVAITDDDATIKCPKCGSHDIQRRGYSTTNTGKYQKFVCKSCGGWARTRYTENDVEVRKALLTNAVQ